MQLQFFLPSLKLTAFILCVSCALHSSAQTKPSIANKANLGVNDTIVVQACLEANGEIVPCSWLDDVYLRAKMTAAQRRRFAEWTRLRNAVYVTYPYAMAASKVMNQINAD